MNLTKITVHLCRQSFPLLSKVSEASDASFAVSDAFVAVADTDVAVSRCLSLGYELLSLGYELFSMRHGLLMNCRDSDDSCGTPGRFQNFCPRLLVTNSLYPRGQMFLVVTCQGIRHHGNTNLIGSWHEAGESLGQGGADVQGIPPLHPLSPVSPLSLSPFTLTP